MDPFSMVIGIVVVSMAGSIAHKYLDTRAAIARAQGGPKDKNVLRAIEELHAEIMALKKHESDAVLSFDSTLQTLDARVKHLEQRALGEGPAARAAASSAVDPSIGEPANAGINRAA